MVNSRAAKYILLVSSLLVVVPLFHGTFVSTARAEALALSGTWGYQDTDSAAHEFNQHYGVDFNKSFEVTELMRFDTGMRYNRDRQPGATREDFSPSLAYNISNEIFMFNISGNANEERNSNTSNSRHTSWSANLNSAWVAAGLRPAVRSVFSRSRSLDDLAPHNLDSDNNNSGISLSWDGHPMKVFYAYNRQESNNYAVGSRNRSDAHLVRIETGGGFWNNRGRVTFSQQYNYTKNINDSKVDEVTNSALVRRNMAGYSGLVDPAAAVSLGLNNLLINGDTSDTAVTVNDPADPIRLSIGVRADSQKVDVLYLYTDTVLTSVVSSQFSWSLYYSNDNTNWVLARAVSSVYDTANKRFVLDISGYQRNFLRVVAVNDPTATAVNFSEIEVYEKVSAAPGSTTARLISKQNNWTTNAGLSLRLRDNLTLTSNLSYESNNYSSGSDQQITRLNGGLSWEPYSAVTLRLNGSLHSTAVTDTPTYETRTYSLTLSSALLPTVDTTLGVTMSDYLEGGDKVSRSYNYNLHMSAALYHDLDASLNASYARNENKREQSSTNTKSTGLLFTARLIPGLTANLSGNYAKSSSSRAVIDSGIELHWRLSDLLSLNSSYHQAWADENSSSAALGINWAMTRNMELALNHTYIIKPGSSHVTALDWRWAVNKNISLMTSGSFTSGPSSWSVNSRLSSRFTAM